MCCGRRRIGGAGSFAAPAPSQSGTPASGAGPVFEYLGRTGLTVVGPVTGIRYRFDRPGARLAVDARDRDALAGVPVLRAVR